MTESRCSPDENILYLAQKAFSCLSITFPERQNHLRNVVNEDVSRIWATLKMGLKLDNWQIAILVVAVVLAIGVSIATSYLWLRFVLGAVFKYLFGDYTAVQALNEILRRFLFTVILPPGLFYVLRCVIRYRSRQTRSKTGAADIAVNEEKMDWKKHNFEMQHPRLPGSNYIRLLAIHPGQHDEDLFGTITYTNNWRLTGYTALSYTWADENEDTSLSRVLYSQLGYMRITKNCDAAIRRLRLLDKIKHVWIDAICIDQSDDQERRYQVAQMGDIYSRASEVVVYIGEEGPETATLFDWMNLVPARSLRAITPWSTDGTSRLPGLRWLGLWLLELGGFIRSLSLSDIFAQNDAPYEPSREMFDAISQSSRRRWFTRTWVLQEVALPPLHNSRIVCGAWSTSASRALHALSFLSRSSNSSDNDLISIFVLLRKRHPQTDISHLLDLVIATRGRSCTDPRDHIYGILSIVHSLDKSIKGTSTTLQADYTLSTAKAFTAFSKYCIEHYGIDFFLALIHKSVPSPALNTHRLPSWTVDLTTDWLREKALNAKDFPAASRKQFQEKKDVDFSDRNGWEVLRIKRPEIISGYLCRDWHLPKSYETEHVSSLGDDEVLVELRQGVAMLLRKVKDSEESVFVRVCPHALSEHGVQNLVRRWSDVICENLTLNGIYEEMYKTEPRVFRVQ